MYSDQDLFCCICSKPFKANVFNSFCQGRGQFSSAVCSRECADEKKHRYALSIIGKRTPASEEKKP